MKKSITLIENYLKQDLTDLTVQDELMFELDAVVDWVQGHDGSLRRISC